MSPPLLETRDLPHRNGSISVVSLIVDPARRKEYEKIQRDVEADSAGRTTTGVIGRGQPFANGSISVVALTPSASAWKFTTTR